MARRSRLLVAPLLLVGLAACPRPFWLGLEGPSGSHSQVFRVSDRPDGTKAIAVHTFRLIRCHVPVDSPDRLIWEITRDRKAGHSDRLATIHYGTVPPGFRETVPSRSPTPGQCYIAQVTQDPNEFGLHLFLRGDSAHAFELFDGFAAERQKPDSANPQPLPDSLRRAVLTLTPHDALAATARSLVAYGFAPPTLVPGDTAFDVGPLTLLHDWRSRPLSRSINCGVYASGGSRVMLPLGPEAKGGLGRLTLAIHVSATPAANGTQLDLEDTVTLQPPWFEQGDRPIQYCHITPELGSELVTAILAQANGPTGPH